MSAVCTGLVATIVANKSEACPTSEATRWTTSGLGSEFERENIFSKTSFCFREKTNKRDKNIFNQVFFCGIINWAPKAPGGINRVFGRTKKILRKKKRLNKNPGRPGLSENRLPAKLESERLRLDYCNKKIQKFPWEKPS